MPQSTRQKKVRQKPSPSDESLDDRKSVMEEISRPPAKTKQRKSHRQKKDEIKKSVVDSGVDDNDWSSYYNVNLQSMLSNLAEIIDTRIEKEVEIKAEATDRARASAAATSSSPSPSSGTPGAISTRERKSKKKVSKASRSPRKDKLPPLSALHTQNSEQEGVEKPGKEKKSPKRTSEKNKSSKSIPTVPALGLIPTSALLENAASLELSPFELRSSPISAEHGGDESRNMGPKNRRHKRRDVNLNPQDVTTAFQNIRFQLIQKDGFVSLEALNRNLVAEFGPKYRWPDELQKLFNGLKRILSSIENCIDTTYALHCCITLHDLQDKIIMKLQDFCDLESFSEIKVGRLVKHPRIVRMFDIASDLSDSMIEPPELTTSEVMEHIHTYVRNLPRMEEKPTSEEQVARIHAALDELATQKGYESRTSLCIFLKAPTFLTFLLSKTSYIRRKVAANFDKHLRDYFHQECELGLEEESMSKIEDCETFSRKLWSYRCLMADDESSDRESDGRAGGKPEGSLDIYRFFKQVCSLLYEENHGMMMEGSTWEQVLRSRVGPLLTCAFTKVNPMSGFGTTLNLMASREVGERALSDAVQSSRTTTTIVDDDDDVLLNVLNCLSAIESRFWLLLNGNDSVHTSFVSYLAEVLNDSEVAGDLHTHIRNRFRGLSTKQKQDFVFEAKGSSSLDANQGNQEAAGSGNQKRDREKVICDHIQSLLIQVKCKDLRDLLNVESRLVAERGVSEFIEFGLGSFINFCVEHQDELTGLPIKSEVMAERNVLEITHAVNKLLESIRSTGRDPFCETERIINVLNNHFAVSEASQMGFTSFDSLIESASQIEGSDSIGMEFALSFDIDMMERSASEVHLFDCSATAEKIAKEGIASAPHLLDLKQWLHWDAIFKEFLGDFAQFVKGVASTSDNDGFLNAEAKFFKYAKHERGAFESYVVSGDARMASSHLVGAIMKEGHVSVVPLHLYSDLCLNSLPKLQPSEARKFVLSCLALAPSMQLRVKAFGPVFLEPLINVMGIEPLLKSCSVVEDLVVLHSCIKVVPTSKMTTSIIHSLANGWTAPTDPEVKQISHQNIEHQKDVRPSALDTAIKGSSAASNVRLKEEHDAQELLQGRGDDQLHPDLETTQSLCLKIKEKFGLNKDDRRDNKTRQQLSELHNLAMRSIKRLAADLYSHDTHFVLELVQNCDDNHYSSSVMPTLNISITDNHLSFDCNEMGFKVEDVYALCNVGSSTKKQGYGYIGHKGIGFKAVFKVTDTPEIHSRKFHFRFDKNDECGLGYIIPRPISIPKGWDQSVGTSIKLPLQNKADSELENIRARVSDIHPSLLLFLRQLSSIRVEDKLKSDSKIMERRVCGNMIELKYSRLLPDKDLEQRIQRWFVVTNDLKPLVHRSNIQSTQISMAMPILDSEAMKNFIPQQEVYAFLPLRCYGFCFVLQADWELPSSREAVDGSSAWNQWLREEVPPLFMKLVDQIMQYIKPLYFSETISIPSNFNQDSSESEEESKQEGEVEGLSSFVQRQEDAIHCLHLLLRMIPLPGQASDFFAAVPQLIVQNLKELKFLPSLSHDFCSPLSLVLPPNNFNARAALNDYLKSASILHPSIKISGNLAQALGIRTFDGNIVLMMEVLQSIAREWNGRSSEKDFEVISWVLSNIDGKGKASKCINELKALRFIPLVDGSSVSFDNGKSILIMEGSNALIPPEACMANAVIIDAGFCKTASTFQGAVPLLRHLGAIQTNGSSFVMDHLIPLMASDKISYEDSVFCLRYAYMHLKQMPKFKFPAFVRALKEKDIWIVNENHEKVRALNCHKLQLGEHYGSDLTFKACWNDIPGLSFVCVSEEYLESGEKEDWRMLFSMLGIRDTFEVLPDDVDDKDLGKVKDYTCPDLDLILQAIVSESSKLPMEDDRLQSVRNVSKSILVHIGKQWDYYSPYIFKYTSSLSPGTLHSSWIESIRTLNWLVGTDASFHAPEKMFVQNKKSQKLLGDCVPYTDVECPSTVYETIGVKTSIDCDTLIEQLSQWSIASEIFFISRVQAEGIYDELSASEDHQMERLKEVKCIFVPHGRPNSQSRQSLEERVPGQFYLPRECALLDKSGLIDSEKETVTDKMVEIAQHSRIRIFKPYYPRMWRRLQNFLLKTGMLEQPLTSHYVQIVKHAATQSLCADSVATVFRVFCNWGYQLQISDDETSSEEDFDDFDDFDENVEKAVSAEAILNEISPSFPCFPIKNGGWASYEEIYFFEDKNLHQKVTQNDSTTFKESLLSACACTSFDGLNDSSDMFKTSGIVIKDLKRNLESFYLEMNIPSLSACCTREANVTVAGKCLRSEHCWFLCVSALILQCWLETRVGNSNSLAETLKKYFLNLKCIEAEDLMKENLISGSSFRLHVSKEPAKSLLDLEQKRLYVSNCAQVDPMSLSEELSSIVAMHTDKALGFECEKLLSRGLGLVIHTPDFQWSNETFISTLSPLADAGIDFGMALREPWLCFERRQEEGSSVDSLLVQAASSPMPSAVSVGDKIDSYNSQSVDSALATSVSRTKELQARMSASPIPIAPMGSLDPANSAPPGIRRGSLGSHFSSSPMSYLPEGSRDMESIDELMLNEWDDMDVDIALVDLHSMDPDLLANLQYVGRQGEKIVDSILRYSSEFENCETVWTNQHVEAGHPYDFVVQLPQGKKIYIEVKATTSCQIPALLPLSFHEVLFATKCEESSDCEFQLWHVAGVNERETSNLSVRRLINPASYFGKGLQLFVRA